MRKQKTTLKDFIKDNTYLLTIFGVFVALTSYLRYTNDNWLIFISFLLSLTIGIALYTELNEIKNKSWLLIIFEMLLITLFFKVTLFIYATYYTFLTFAIFFGIFTFVTVCMVKLRTEMYGRLGEITDKRLFNVFMIFLSSIILIISMSYFETIKPIAIDKIDIFLLINSSFLGFMVFLAWFLFNSIISLIKGEKTDWFFETQ